MASFGPDSNTGDVAAVVVVEHGGDTDILCCNTKNHHITSVCNSLPDELRSSDSIDSF